MTKELYLKTFENGLPFYSEEFDLNDNGIEENLIKLNIDDIYDRLSLNLPSVIILDGGSGQGKTTLATEIVDYINSKTNKPKMELNGSQYAKGGKEFIKKLRTSHLEGYKICVYDEGGDLNKKTTLSKFNRTMDMVFNQMRVYDVIVIIILQCVGNLENDLFQKGVVRMLINCYGRKDLIKSNFRAYELDRINYLRQALKKEVTPTKAYQKITANCYGIFYNLNPKREEELHQVGYKKKDEDINLSDIKMDGLLNYQDLAHKTQQSLSTVRNKISQLKIKPDRFYKKKAYFKEEVITLI